MTKVSPSAVYCLDSFALLSFLQGEQAADQVRDVLNRKQTVNKPNLWMCEINFAEVAYQIIRRFGCKICASAPVAQ